IQMFAAAGGKNKLAVHLKIDTGMGRIGCRADQAPDLARMISKTPGIVLAGVC
ncbi:MAG TPA: alanine racemase, partial [Spirochaeta sp.]|nr:alanine racemase [Spirochaeta sp.]